MRIFVAGATGVLGRRSVRRLVEAGHHVTGVARCAEKAERLRGLGAEAATVDLFDPVATGRAVAGHDAVVNLATHIPPTTKAARAGAWAENARIRTEVSGSLVDAALEAGAQRVVQESITLPYPDRGGEWIDESEALVDSPQTDPVRAAEAAAAHFARAGGDRIGVVLRFGLLYAPDTQHTVDALRLARLGFRFLPGTDDGYVSQVHADDAADAVVAALAVPSGTFNVVDDQPLTRAELASALAAAVGRSRLRPLPRLVVKLGGRYLEVLARSQRVSNRRLTSSSSWTPAHPSARRGWPAVVEGAR